MNLHWDDKEAITVGDCIILPQFELATPDRSSCNESNELEKHGGIVSYFIMLFFLFTCCALNNSVTYLYKLFLHF